MRVMASLKIQTEEVEKKKHQKIIEPWMTRWMAWIKNKYKYNNKYKNNKSLNSSSIQCVNNAK